MAEDVKPPAPPGPHVDEFTRRRLDADVQHFEATFDFAVQEEVEQRWDARLGVQSRDLRALLGITAGMIVGKGAHPRLVADYLRESLQQLFPTTFDSPI